MFFEHVCVWKKIFDLSKKQLFIHFIHETTVAMTTTTDQGVPYFWQKPFFTFQHPFGARIVGPTQVGKTHHVIKLLQKCKELIQPPPTKIYWAYGEKNERQMARIQQACPLPVHFIEGIPDSTEFNSEENNLLILDDLMDDSSNSKTVSNLFTRSSHHRNMSVILMLQNLFPKGKAMRDVNLNARYLTLFCNPHDRQQILYLARKLFPENPHYLVDAYEQATARNHGYLLIDLGPHTPKDRRLFTGLFPPEIPTSYVPINKKPRLR
jgi:hypothetical protein